MCFSDPALEIGILDVFGFEEFQRNGFEQVGQFLHKAYYPHPPINKKKYINKNASVLSSSFLSPIHLILIKLPKYFVIYFPARTF